MSLSVRPRIASSLCALAGLLTLCGATRPPAPAPICWLRQVAPGVELIQEVTPAAAPDGPLLVHVLRIDPAAPGVRVEAALGQDTVWGGDPTQGREAVSRLAARRGAVAAVNAGFFPFAGNPIGLHIEQGDLVTEPTLRRTSLVFPENGPPRCAAFDFAAAVTLGEASRPLHGLNRKPGKGDELLLFTPRFAAATLPAPGRVEVVLEGVPSPFKPGAWTAAVRSVAEGGATPLEPGIIVLSGGGASAEFLRAQAAPGATARLRLELRPLGEPGIDPATIQHAVTGAPRIVAGGRVDIRLDAEGLRPAFSTTRHPRTAAGITADGKLLLATIDGRQSGLSRGATLAETAQALIRLGAVDAVNLDGGGSSAAVVHGGVVNSPSGGAERPVADALLVFAPSPPAEAPTLALAGLQEPLAVGERFAFALPPGVDPASAIWSATGGAGFIGQDGVFHALRPGRAVIRLSAGSWSAAVPAVVSAPPGPAP